MPVPERRKNTGLWPLPGRLRVWSAHLARDNAQPRPLGLPGDARIRHSTVEIGSAPEAPGLSLQTSQQAQEAV